MNLWIRFETKFRRALTFKPGRPRERMPETKPESDAKKVRTIILRCHAVFISALAFAFASNRMDASLTTITAADAGHSITLRIGQELALNLENNPSTGYRWFLASTPNSILTSLGKPTGSPSTRGCWCRVLGISGD